MRRYSINFAIFSVLLDAGLTLIALVVATELRPNLPAFPFLQPTAPEIQLPFVLYIAIPTLYVSVFLISSLYDPKHTYRLVDELQTLTLSSAFAAVCFAGLLYLSFDFRGISRWLFILFVALSLALLIAWRLLARVFFKLVDMDSAKRRVLIAGAGDEGQQVAQLIREYNWMDLDLVGFLDDRKARINGLPVLGRLSQVSEVVRAHDIQDVVIALSPDRYRQVNQLILTLHDLPVHARMVPDYFSLALYRAQAEEFGGLSMISLRDPAMNGVERLVKRLMDLFLGAVLTLLALPAMLVIALAIKLTSRGPVIFRQQRVGENAELFTMYKFRTMVDGAERLQPEVSVTNDEGDVIHKRPDDPRVTRIGSFLRRTSLDEVPQLLNVLKGDMSLVGPRPELPWLAAQYEPWQRKRFAVPQGITGWWQVNGRSEKPMHLHTEDDLYYVQHYSIWMDLYILLKTVLVVLRGRGAY